MYCIGLQLNLIESSSIVHTYPLAKQLNIPEHGHKQQVDAINITRLLVDNLGGDQNDFSLFNMTETTSTLCMNCNKESFSTIRVPILSLDIVNIVKSNQQHSIDGIMNIMFDPRGYPRRDYKCKIDRDENGNEIVDECGVKHGCDKTGYCTQSCNLTVQGDYMIIHLKIYAEDDYGRRTKLFPRLVILSALKE